MLEQPGQRLLAVQSQRHSSRHPLPALARLLTQHPRLLLCATRRCSIARDIGSANVPGYSQYLAFINDLRDIWVGATGEARLAGPAKHGPVPVLCASPGTAACCAACRVSGVWAVFGSRYRVCTQLPPKLQAGGASSRRRLACAVQTGHRWVQVGSRQGSWDSFGNFMCLAVSPLSDCGRLCNLCSDLHSPATRQLPARQEAPISLPLPTAACSGGTCGMPTMPA